MYRYSVAPLGVLAAAVLLLVGAETHRLLPVFAIGVVIGFTISQTGLVRHWLQQRGRGWVGKVTLNGTGAVLTAVAAVVLFASKFTEGAWLLLLLLLVPGLMPSVSSEPKSRRDASLSSCSPTSNRGADRYRVLHNQRGPLLATTIRGRTDAIVATLPIRLD
jgi:hypothetical protein